MAMSGQRGQSALYRTNFGSGCAHSPQVFREFNQQQFQALAANVIAVDSERGKWSTFFSS